MEPNPGVPSAGIGATPTLVENAGTPLGAGPGPAAPDNWMVWFTEQQRVLLQQVSAHQLQILDQLYAAQQAAQTRMMNQIAEMLRTPRGGAAPTGAGSWAEANPWKLTKMGPQDDAEAFINTFERIATAAKWPRDQWALLLAPCLTGPAQEAVDTLPPTDAKDYDRVKEVILHTLNISEDTYRRRLRELRWAPGLHPRTLGQKVKANALRWLKPAVRSATEVAEQIMIEQYVMALPSSARNWVRCHRPQALDEAMLLMEAFATAEESEFGRSRRPVDGVGVKGMRPAPDVGLKSKGHGAETHEDKKSGRGGEGLSKPALAPAFRERVQKPLTCFSCGLEGHLRRDCPMMECSWADTWEAAQAWREREALWAEETEEEGSEPDEDLGAGWEDAGTHQELPVMTPLSSHQQQQGPWMLDRPSTLLTGGSCKEKREEGRVERARGGLQDPGEREDRPGKEEDQLDPRRESETPPWGWEGATGGLIRRKGEAKGGAEIWRKMETRREGRRRES
ncbi:uncharacterized protein LOC121934032 [Sceloporus undulatus]|uniref:uncharacterized protein LOC121934032 n=1 Tax=Sceloporus undulatus TaxID=8520 RepID=UPI001C4B4F30|nr:uncharacterized protein LOC121934032 [Sceloporus undulatus]